MKLSKDQERFDELCDRVQEYLVSIGVDKAVEVWNDFVGDEDYFSSYGLIRIHNTKNLVTDELTEWESQLLGGDSVEDILIDVDDGRDYFCDANDKYAWIDWQGRIISGDNEIDLIPHPDIYYGFEPPIDYIKMTSLCVFGGDEVLDKHLQAMFDDFKK